MSKIEAEGCEVVIRLTPREAKGVMYDHGESKLVIPCEDLVATGQEFNRALGRAVEAAAEATEKVSMASRTLYNLAYGLAAEVEPRFSREHLRAAVAGVCTCGGHGPEDDDACPACLIWHALVTEREAEGEVAP